ncbi:MAG: flagellar hook-associated protein FlgK [Phycisphaerales bacterium]|nr:flagellar hook-associated protein FlgK [Phycisphaerales bacterium]
MGLTSALGVGRTALAAYQAALQVAGQNIANVATPGYTRTRADLSAIPGAGLSVGQLGRGVQITSIRRSISETLQSRLRTAISDKESAGTERNSLNRIESLFDPLGDRNLGSLLSEFFASLGDLQNNPDNIATRGIVISTASSLTQRIGDIRGDLIGLRDEINREIETITLRADQITTQIAELNGEITLAESGSAGPAAALRDQRDQLLSELSEYFAISVREQPGGAVNVYIGNESVVQFGTSFGLKTTQELDTNGLTISVVRFQLNDGPVTAKGGLVEGLITSRDVHNFSRFAELDSLSGALIHEINKVHSGGRGLEDFSDLTGLTEVLDSSLALNTPDNGIPFLPQTGSFFIDVKDSSGTVVRTQVNIDLDGIGADTTLDSLAADITANVPNLTATVTANGKLQLTADNGFTFAFADDTSGVLASLGLNTFFAGKDSLDIEVNPLLVNNSALLAAAQSDFAGDGSNATALVAVQDSAIASLSGASLNEFYNSAMANIAVSSSAATSATEAAEIIFESLTVQRESISGVNLDEEAVALISFQRAYEGAARYMRVVDEMLQTLLTLVR